MAYHNPRETADPTCDLVYSALHVLLLRSHTASKRQRLNKTSIFRSNAAASSVELPPLLQSIIDILQYREFWERVRDEIERVVAALTLAGVSTRVHYNPVADSGEALVTSLQAEKNNPVGGEALLRIDDRWAYEHDIPLYHMLT